MNDTARKNFSSRYSCALRTHSRKGDPATFEEAQSLGALAASMGLETRGLARIHEDALAALVELRGPQAFGRLMRKRVADFFAAAMTPVDENRPSVAEASDDLIQLNKILALRTGELADSRKELERSIAERKGAEATLEVARNQSSLLLGEARDLEGKLQELTRRILGEHEGERKDRSLVLNVGIAQALLGIHVHLLALDREISVSGRALKKKFAKAQRMVDRSVEVINRLVKEFGIDCNV